MLKPKQLFIIIYVDVCMKRVYPYKTNNSILFRYGKIPESQEFAMIELDGYGSGWNDSPGRCRPL